MKELNGDYRKVKCLDRLPDKSGKYHVILDSLEKEFLAKMHMDSSTNASLFFRLPKKEWYKKDMKLRPSYWLEEIVL